MRSYLKPCIDGARVESEGGTTYPSLMIAPPFAVA